MKMSQGRMSFLIKKSLFYSSFSCLIFILSYSVYPLVPLDSKLLGKLDFTNEHDKLNYLDVEKHSHEDKWFFYQGFYWEQNNLMNSCSQKNQALYANLSAKKSAMRTVVSSLQYVGLDLTVRAITQYAKELDMSEEEFTQLAENLIQNSCSKNITVISLRQLKANLLVKFKSPKFQFKLPTVKDNPYFSDLIQGFNKPKKVLQSELVQTLKLFRNFCSWSGDENNVRFMAHLLNDPGIMSFLIRQLSGQKMTWKKRPTRFYLSKKKDTLKTICQGQICRLDEENKFNYFFPKTISFKSVRKDLEHLYCNEFKNITHSGKNESSKKIQSWMKKQTLDDNFYEVSQFIALITGIPEFTIGVSHIEDTKDLLKTSIDERWLKWSLAVNRENTQKLFYEESLTIEKVDRGYYFYHRLPKFRVVLDVNLGELDRSTRMLGKIKMSFKLKFVKSFLKWVRQQALTLKPNQKDEKKDIKSYMVKNIEDKIHKMRDQLTISPWETGLTEVVADELLTQLKNYRGDFFIGHSHEKIEVPIDLYYGAFALKYIRFRFLSQKSLEGKKVKI